MFSRAIARLTTVKSVAALPFMAVRAAGSTVGSCVATFSTEATDDEKMAEYFLKLDAEEAKNASTEEPLPIALSGISGGIATRLFRGKNFDASVKQLSALLAVVDESPDVVHRFFKHANYQPAECQAALDLLLNNTVNLKKYDAIKDDELREVIVGPKETVGDWVTARDRVKALKLSAETTEVMKEIAALGRLDLLRPLSEKMDALKVAQANTIEVTVASSVELTAAQKKDVEKALPKYAEGQNLAVNFEVDAGTLGGLMVTMGNRSIDLTNGTRLMEVMQH